MSMYNCDTAVWRAANSCQEKLSFTVIHCFKMLPYIYVAFLIGEWLQQSMMRTKEKEEVMNLIYKDYCKLSNAFSSNSNLVDMKSSMINPNGGLDDYLDNNSKN